MDEKPSLSRFRKMGRKMVTILFGKGEFIISSKQLKRDEKPSFKVCDHFSSTFDYEAINPVHHDTY